MSKFSIEKLDFLLFVVDVLLLATCCCEHSDELVEIDGELVEPVSLTKVNNIIKARLS